MFPRLFLILHRLLLLLLVVVLQILNAFICYFGIEMGKRWAHLATHQTYNALLVMHSPYGKAEFDRFALCGDQFCKRIQQLLGNALSVQVAMSISERVMFVEQYAIDVSDLFSELGFSFGQGDQVMAIVICLQVESLVLQCALLIEADFEVRMYVLMLRILMFLQYIQILFGLALLPHFIIDCRIFSISQQNDQQTLITTCKYSTNPINLQDSSSIYVRPLLLQVIYKYCPFCREYDKSAYYKLALLTNQQLTYQQHEIMTEQKTPTMAIDYETFTTPSLASSLSNNKRLLHNSRTFISSRFRFKKSRQSQSNIYSPKHPKINDTSKDQTVSMLKLGEWLRLSASIHGFGRNVFDLALVMLKQVSNSLPPTYSLAAASLSLASKIDSSQHIRGFKQIPARTTGRFPRVSISEVIHHQQRLLKALNFNVPIEYNRLLILLQVGKRWNLYLKRNSHLLKLPLHLIEVGTKQNYQKVNLKSVSYLLDLIILTLKNGSSEQEVYVIAAAVVVGALNCCQIRQIVNESFILIRFAKGFLRKCYKKSDRQLQYLVKLLAQIYEHELWKKISLIPPQQKNEQRLDLSEQQISWKWLNQLQLIPFEEQISLEV